MYSAQRSHGGGEGEGLCSGEVQETAEHVNPPLSVSLLVSFPSPSLTHLQDNIENVVYIWALCRDQTIYDRRMAWRVMEFAIQHSGKLLV